MLAVINAKPVKSNFSASLHTLLYTSKPKPKYARPALLLCKDSGISLSVWLNTFCIISSARCKYSASLMRPSRYSSIVSSNILENFLKNAGSVSILSVIYLAVREAIVSALAALPTIFSTSSANFSLSKMFTKSVIICTSPLSIWVSINFCICPSYCEKSMVSEYRSCTARRSFKNIDKSLLYRSICS